MCWIYIRWEKISHQQLVNTLANKIEDKIDDNMSHRMIALILSIYKRQRSEICELSLGKLPEIEYQSLIINKNLPFIIEKNRFDLLELYYDGKDAFNNKLFENN